MIYSPKVGQILYMKIKLSDDKELIEEIDKQLDRNLELYGERYCPCAIVHDKDSICMCKIFREEIEEGSCPCGKYVKVLS